MEEQGAHNEAKSHTKGRGWKIAWEARIEKSFTSSMKRQNREMPSICFYIFFNENSLKRKITLFSKGIRIRVSGKVFRENVGGV